MSSRDTSHQSQLLSSNGEVVATTESQDGQVYDWIKPESQVESGIAQPPPPLEGKVCQQTTGAHMETGPAPKSELESDETLLGPVGTVPMLRKKPALAHFRFSQTMSKTGPPDSSGRIAVFASAPEKHWYASSAQYVRNYGGGGHFSCWNPIVETANDFSLLQVAIINQNGAYDANIPRIDYRQSVEAGWIHYPARFGDNVPHLFTFYTTVGYERYGDYIQSWNTDYKGWVQTDRTITPGITFKPLNVSGGDQYKLWIEYQLFDGNWWLWVKDRWIGYYPASLFSAGHIATKTLSDHADQINFYGEIFDSNEVRGLTTTDMGSGKFPGTGWQHSGFITNMVHQPKPSAESGAKARYDGSAGLFMDDTARYQIEAHFDNEDTWASFCWVGGPGSG